MNVEPGSNAASWDGAVVSSNASALPTGLTTGTNAIWIGTSGDLASEFNSAGMVPALPPEPWVPLLLYVLP
ncbi:MAG: hypothetical protein IPI66_01025 [Chitinophagaceae bacterium]|nr:hypothetical protein [Chitinophagaceae bacterium]